MSYFSLASAVIKLILMFVQWKQRAQIVSEVEQIERAKQIIEIQARLTQAAQLDAEIAGLTSEELDQHVESKGWFRD
jgi:hypothetical protein